MSQTKHLKSTVEIVAFKIALDRYPATLKMVLIECSTDAIIFGRNVVEEFRVVVDKCCLVQLVIH